MSINVNGNIDAVIGNVGPVNDNLGTSKKLQIVVIKGKLLFKRK